MVLSQGAAGSDGVLDPTAVEPPRLVLVSFSFWLARAACAESPPDPHDLASGTSPQPDPPDPAALRGAITAQFAGLGFPGAEPLRWAITAVDPLRGLQLEGVGVIQAHQSQESR